MDNLLALGLVLVVLHWIASQAALLGLLWYAMTQAEKIKAAKDSTKEAAKKFADELAP